MKEVRYVLADPTGNLTCLVLDPVPPVERPAVTARLMDRCEQVGYLAEARREGAVLRLEMMGGEFCGNASMAAAALLAEQLRPLPGDRLDLPLEVSGAEGIVPCRMRKTPSGWQGAVSMPLPTGMAPCELQGVPLTAVFLPGIVHLIYEGEPLSSKAAESLLTAAKTVFPDQPALGLMQYAPAESRLTPLVWVKESDTMVWETACGSGTTAVAWGQSMRLGKPLSLTVNQPGGALQAEVKWEEGGIRRILLMGDVRLHPVEILEI